MAQGNRRFTVRHRVIGALVAAGLAYAVMASFTRPFTVSADVVTALPLAAAAAAVAVRARSARRPTLLVEHNQGADLVPRLNRLSWVWMALTAAVASWELACFISMPRTEHPTLSTLIDMLDSSRAGKTSAFTLWLLLGCYLVLQ